MQQRRNAEAELGDVARRWAVLKAASVLLGGALEHHRAARRDPLMTRAASIRDVDGRRLCRARSEFLRR